MTLLAGAVSFGQEADAALRDEPSDRTEEEAAEPVITRAWAHDGFGRIVFDWTRPVIYEAGIASRNLVVMFDRPLGTTFEQVARHLGDYIAICRAQSRRAERQSRTDRRLPAADLHLSAVRTRPPKLS